MCTVRSILTMENRLPCDTRSHVRVCAVGAQVFVDRFFAAGFRSVRLQPIGSIAKFAGQERFDLDEPVRSGLRFIPASVAQPDRNIVTAKSTV